VYNPIKPVLRKLFSKDNAFIEAISRITGITPGNVYLYKLALTHTSYMRSQNGGAKHETNERLEFLGDSILGAVVAEFLYKKFPYKDEGFMTELRSRIVNRESLNQTAIRIGLNMLVKVDQGNQAARYKSINGNALEALVGAIYLDQGYKKTRRFVLDKLIKPHFDIHTLINTTINFKSKLIEWVQSNNKAIRFEIIKQVQQGNSSEFTSQVWIDEEAVAVGSGNSKKKAEQAAAEKALQVLAIA
jgi:ribonuclease III